MPRLSAFMRENLQNMFKPNERPGSPEDTGAADARLSTDKRGSGSRSVGGSIVGVALHPDESNQSVNVEVTDVSQPRLVQQDEASAVKLDITSLLSVNIQPSAGESGAGGPTEMQVSERQCSSHEEPLIAVKLSVVPESVCICPSTACSAQSVGRISTCQMLLRTQIMGFPWC